MKCYLSKCISTLYFSIPNVSIQESPSKDRSKLVNKVSTLEANLLRAQRESKEASELVEELRDKVKVTEKERDKARKREEVSQTRLAALKEQLTILFNESLFV